MPLKLQTVLILAALATFPALAQEAKPATPPDSQKLSYALGMSLALDMKDVGVEVDATVVGQAVQDVLQGKPAGMQESEIRSILRRAEEIGRFKQSSKNIAEGEAFLARNASVPGVNILPDGLQYKVLETGPGNYPKRIEILTLKFRGTWINGREFNHNERLDIPFWGCPRGLQEALLKMKVGSRWQIYVPYNLAYGHVGEQAQGYGLPLIYDLELVNAESETARPNQHHGAGRLGHSLDEDLLPAKFRSSTESSQ